MRVMYYSAKYVNLSSWIKLEYYVRMDSTYHGEVECRHSRDDMYADEFAGITQGFIDEELSSDDYQLYALKTSVEYDPDKWVWLAPDGRIYYARKTNPSKDPAPTLIGQVPQQFMCSIGVDIRELRKQINRVGTKDPNETVLGRALFDIMAVCTVLPFLTNYNVSLATLSEEVEEAMHCLSEREQLVLKLRCGNCGEPVVSWNVVGKEISRARGRAKQITERALRKLKKRIVWNRARERLHMPIETKVADY